MKLLRMAFAPLAAMALLMKDVFASTDISTELHLAGGPTDPGADLDLIMSNTTDFQPQRKSLLGRMTTSLTNLAGRATDVLAAPIDTVVMPNRGRPALVT